MIGGVGGYLLANMARHVVLQLDLAVLTETPLRCFVDRHLVVAKVEKVFNLEELLQSCGTTTAAAQVFDQA